MTDLSQCSRVRQVLRQHSAPSLFHTVQLHQVLRLVLVLLPSGQPICTCTPKRHACTTGWASYFDSKPHGHDTRSGLSQQLWCRGVVLQALISPWQMRTSFDRQSGAHLVQLPMSLQAVIASTNIPEGFSVVVSAYSHNVRFQAC